MSYYPNDCHKCGKPIRGEWESQIALAIETGEIEDKPSHRLFIYDKHIRCSPSRSQRIVHPRFPTVIDDRPQFDWRPEANNHWTDEMRSHWKKVYTEAWERLQLRSNPKWENQRRMEKHNRFRAVATTDQDDRI
tara:strand:+ start:283 stop:684 length:402 start_codon:yes stop_codon:yes gene_type:complete